MTLLSSIILQKKADLNFSIATDVIFPSPVLSVVFNLGSSSSPWLTSDSGVLSARVCVPAPCYSYVHVPHVPIPKFMYCLCFGYYNYLFRCLYSGIGLLTAPSVMQHKAGWERGREISVKLCMGTRTAVWVPCTQQVPVLSAFQLT